jgi:hypothetical protein
LKLKGFLSESKVSLAVNQLMNHSLHNSLVNPSMNFLVNVRKIKNGPSGRFCSVDDSFICFAFDYSLKQ